MSRFVIRAVATGFKFDLNAPNGEGILTSEVYTSRALARKGAQSVRKAAAKARIQDQTREGREAMANPKFEMYRDSAGEFRFRLRARNGKIIGISDGYTSRTACENGMESVRKNAPGAETAEE